MHAHTPRWTLALACLSACAVDVRVADDTGGASGGSTGILDGTTGGAAQSSSGPVGSSGAALGSSEDSSGSAGGDIKLDVGAADSDGVPQPVGCIGGNDLIWVLVLNQDEGRQPELHRFDPQNPGFEFVADMDCLDLKSVGDNPLSMGVSRSGQALISLDDFEGLDQGPFLASFDLFADDPCSTVERIDWNPPGQANSLVYTALDPDNPEAETVFANTNSARSFGEVRFDLPIVAVDYVGQSPYAQLTLSGTADGRLYALAADDLWADGALVEIDPATGSETEFFFETTALAHPAFYGGDILLFEINRDYPYGWRPIVRRYDLDDDDGSGENELTEIFGEADDPPNLWIRAVASPTCVPLGPEG